jgi:pimeloyl-ACP methyl ester carboxylesterase
MEQAITTVAGLRAPILRAGAPSPEAVVFLHGNPGSGNDWRQLAGQAGAFGRALAPDMPGFGQADKPADFDYTVDGYARYLDALLQAEGVQRVHLVLHDFGGPWGLAWAERHADRVASVTLVNIGLMPGYRWHIMARLWRTPLLGELFMATTNRSGFKLSLKRGNPRGLPDAYLEEMNRNFDKGTRRAVLRLYRNTGDVSALSERIAGVLAPRRIPALVVWGAADPYVPARYAEVQRQFFDVRRVALLGDSGHWPMIDNPAAVGEAVLPFLREQLAAR